MRKTQALLLSLLATGWIASALYLFSASKSEQLETILVSRVIDGDTLETKGGKVLRLANINTPERGTYGYAEASTFLKKYENTTLQARLEGTDKGGRRYVSRVYTLQGEYLNLRIVQEGLASKAWVEPSEKKLFAQAEQEAMRQGKGLWKSSPYANCIQMSINPRNESITLKNRCKTLSLQGWWIKDESRQIYHFTNTSLTTLTLYTHQGTNTATKVYWNKKEDVWNNDADTAYLFDKENRLVSVLVYGYTR